MILIPATEHFDERGHTMRWIVGIAGASLLAVGARLPAQRQDAGEAWAHLAKLHDQNSDGKITRDEYDRADETFARLDRNGDGAITEEDFQRGRGAGGQRRGGQRGNPRGAAAPGRRGGGNQAFLIVAPEIGKAADLDRSGDVPKAEWKEFLATLAADGDGAFEATKIPVFAAGGPMIRRVSIDVDRDGDTTIADLDEIFARMDRNDDGTLQREELGPLPIPGDEAPNFELAYADEPSNTVELASFEGRKPVALIFGSYT
jgi:hypothetical protein